jgi:hypothetical protein
MEEGRERVKSAREKKLGLELDWTNKSRDETRRWDDKIATI